MGEIIIKADRDRELYLLWFTSADGPGWAFDSREKIQQYLWDEWNRQHPYCIPKPGHGPEARLDRADAYGTSVPPPEPAYGWDDEAWGVGDDCPRDGYSYELPRANLVAYTEAVLANDEEAKHAQLRRHKQIREEDEDDTDPGLD